MMEDFSLDFSLDNIFDEPQPEKKEPEQPEQKHISVKHRYARRHIARKAASEQALMDSLNWYFEPGDCYHCFSFGDVDSMSFFKHVLRQQRVKYLALSTWCMAGEDVDDLKKWWQLGYVGRVDFYLGEIFQSQYPEVAAAADLFARQEGGRICVFRNHSKVMAIVGEKFDCLIESSANVNTNPRSENTVLTVDTDLVNYYIDLFNGIVPFNKEFRDAPLYHRS